MMLMLLLVLQELKTGMNESSVFKVFHPDAMDLFTVCSSLEKVRPHLLRDLFTPSLLHLLVPPITLSSLKVCSDLRDPKTRLNEASIAYFTPFRPMLGQRAVIDQVTEPDLPCTRLSI